MKKFIYPVVLALLLSNISCNKSAEGNTGVLPVDSTATKDITEVTDRYVADDGTSTLVTFKTDDGKKSISITSNKMTIQAPETETAGVYADHDFQITAKNDSVTITQGDNVIKLKKARVN